MGIDFEYLDNFMIFYTCSLHKLMGTYLSFGLNMYFLGPKIICNPIFCSTLFCVTSWAIPPPPYPWVEGANNEHLYTREFESSKKGAFSLAHILIHMLDHSNTLQTRAFNLRAWRCIFAQVTTMVLVELWFGPTFTYNYYFFNLHKTTTKVEVWICPQQLSLPLVQFGSEDKHFYGF